MMDERKRIHDKLPKELSEQIDKLPQEVLASVEEIRMKTGRQVLVYALGKEYIIPLTMTKEMVQAVFTHILNHSVYAYQEELKNGYITIEGGHRAGFCGRVVLENGEVKTVRDISSVNLRRSREILGASDRYFPYLKDPDGRFYNTILVSPPKCGKTTLLRDLIRNLSGSGFKVSVCDERSEIAGCDQGVPSFDLGHRTDVLDGCPKEKGMIMLIRSMSPDVIATDEIGKKEDCYAVEAAVCAGIGLLTTIHGSSYKDVLDSGIGDLVRRGVFHRLVFLSSRPKTGTVTVITDHQNNTLWRLP